MISLNFREKKKFGLESNFTAKTIVSKLKIIVIRQKIAKWDIFGLLYSKFEIPGKFPENFEIPFPGNCQR